MSPEELARSNPETEGLPPLLRALAFIRHENLDAAHRIVQNDNSKEAAWIHALIHRLEGDLDNARYWYGRAGRKESHAGDEWMTIATALCEQKSKNTIRPE